MAVAPPQSAPAKRSGLRTFGYVIGGLLLLLVLAVAGLALFPPTGFLKSQVIAAVKQATGRDLTIAGPARFTVLPAPSMHLELVSLAGLPGGADLLKADSVEAKAKLWPLLQGRFEVESAKIQKPAITISPGNLAVPVAVAAAPAATPPPAKKTNAFVLSKLTLADGTISILPDAKGTAWKADQLAADVVQQGAGGPLKMNGTLRSNGEAVAFDASLADPSALQENGPSAFEVVLKAKPANADLKGNLDLKQGTAVAGDLSIKTDSWPDFARWIGAGSMGANAAGPASLTGKVTATPALVKLDGATLDHPAAKTTGSAEVRLDGPRPALKANLAAANIDLNKLFPGVTSTARSASLEATASPSPEDAQLVIPSGWESLAQDLGAIASGQTAATTSTRSLEAATTAASPWSNDPIDMSLLQAADLDIALVADKVAYGQLPLQKGDLLVTNREGRLDVALKQIEVEKGKASGTLSVDSTAKPPKASLGVNLNGVSADRLIATLADRHLLTGSTKADVTLTAAGASERELVGSLGGTAKVTVEKGAITGFNLRTSILEWWKSWAYDSKQKTPFEKLDGAYAVNKGVLKSTGDISLQGPDVSITAAGSVSLLSKTIDQAVRLKIAPPPPSTLQIPVKVQGSWSKPAISLDWGSVFASANVLAAPPSLAPSGAPIPEAARQQIESVLNAPASAGLSSDARAMLRSWVDAAPR